MGQRPSCYHESSPGALWEVVDDKVVARAQNYRTSLQKTWKQISFRDILSSIRDLYLELDLQPLMEHQLYETIQGYFKDAYDKNEVEPVIKAYTSSQEFSSLVNKDLAQSVRINNLRDIGISPEISEDRCYWEGPLDIACILVNHPGLNDYQIKEEMQVFRGMTVKRRVLGNYRAGTRLMNKTFLSTSKFDAVAQTFTASTADEVGCMCIYTLVPSERRTAIDIENLSIYRDESEVLILPYTIFEVKKITLPSPDTNQDYYIIELHQCHS